MTTEQSIRRNNQRGFTNSIEHNIAFLLGGVLKDSAQGEDVIKMVFKNPEAHAEQAFESAASKAPGGQFHRGTINARKVGSVITLLVHF
jgi:hypothetical protein